MSNEAALVLYCLRLDENKSTHDKVKQIVSVGVNWDEVLSIVGSNGVLPIFRENTLRYCPEEVPHSTMALIQSEFRLCAVESLGYAYELARVYKYLEQHGVRAIALKGPALAQQLGLKFCLRRCRDLDLLIDKNQFENAVTALRLAGYICSQLQDETGQTAFRSDKHSLLVSETGRFQIELHWALALPGSQFPLHFADLWNRRAQISVLGRSISVPGKEDLLLILCFHAAMHEWKSLKWIYDIAELLKQDPNLNWAAVLTQARRLGCRRILLAGVTLARDIMALRLPTMLESEAVCDSSVDRIRRDALFRFSTGAPSRYGIERYLNHVRSRERFRDRSRMIFYFVRQRLAPNARDREWIHLPDALSFLYIFVRVVRLTCCRAKVSVTPLLKAIVSS